MQVLNIFHVLIAIAMVALVLIQRGTGATAGAAFGSGASGTVFGARGAGNFLTRSTWVLATLFCAISLTMAVVVSRSSATPTTDLGVVSTVPAADRRSETAPVPSDVPPSGQTKPTDLPPLAAPQDSAAAPVAEDLPALDDSAAEPVEVEPENSAPAAPADGS